MNACYQVSKPKNLEKTKSLNFENLSFTPREVDILSCLLSGRSFKSIALVLRLSPKTVEAHMRNILSKMQCHTREGVISRLEGSPTYESLKHHYFQILLVKNKSEVLEKLSPLLMTKSCSTISRVCQGAFSLHSSIKLTGIINHSPQWHFL